MHYRNQTEMTISYRFSVVIFLGTLFSIYLMISSVVLNLLQLGLKTEFIIIFYSRWNKILNEFEIYEESKIIKEIFRKT